MTRLTKILLVLGLAGLVAGLVIDLSSFTFPLAFTVFLPGGAVLLQLAVISRFLEKEAALFDKEESERLLLVQSHASPVRSRGAFAKQTLVHSHR